MNKNLRDWSNLIGRGNRLSGMHRSARRLQSGRERTKGGGSERIGGLSPPDRLDEVGPGDRAKE